MNFLNWFFSFFKSPHYTGVNPDPRTASEKNQDYLHEERAVALPVDPFGNTRITQSPYFYENQQQTSSCVPHGVGLALAIERKADAGLYQRIAQMFPYRLRSNYPGEGSYLQEIFDLYRHKGAPLFTSLPTPRTEQEANAITLTQQQYTEAEIFKGLTYYTVKDPSNIDTLAGIAAQGHGVAILIYASQDEWGRDYPFVSSANITKQNAEVRHCVCVLPNSGFMKDGQKYVAIQDSAWFGGKQLRYLSELFIRARCYGAGYWDKVQVIGYGPLPKYNFTKVLNFGDKGPEVTAMQKLLIAEGKLPNDCATGFFGGRTLAAVNAFQSEYAADILLPQGLQKPTGRWGQGCIKVANRLCA